MTPFSKDIPYRSNKTAGEKVWYNESNYGVQYKICFFWRDSPQWARVSSFMRFLDHTQRRTKVGRTPLDE